MKMVNWKFVFAFAVIGFGIGNAFPSPQIQFDSTVFNFGKATAGQTITHDFVFTNTGTQTLEIGDVRPTCGCTVAGVWDRRIEPGKTGTIPIRYTPAYSDKDVSKTVIVFANDPRQTNIILQIVGAIWQPIDVQPAFVMFGVTAESQTNQTQVVRVLNNLDQPLTLSEPMTGNRCLKTSVKTLQPGKEFELQITLVPPFEPGSKTVPITVKTSSASLPVINLTAFISVKPEISSTPARIVLPPGPLPSGIKSKVTIENNGSRSLALSEPQANIDGITSQLKEIETGRKFALEVNFPAGFQIKQNQNVELKIKTDDAKRPFFTLPIVQNHRLATMSEEQ